MAEQIYLEPFTTLAPRNAHREIKINQQNDIQGGYFFRIKTLRYHPSRSLIRIIILSCYDQRTYHTDIFIVSTANGLCDASPRDAVLSSLLSCDSCQKSSSPKFPWSTKINVRHRLSISP